MKRKQKRVFDNAFYDLAASVDKSLKAAADDSTQQQQVDNLLQLERQFRDLIVASPQGNSIYKKFISHIVVENANILTAGPFFRERRGVLTKQISPALREGKYQALKKHNINFKMANFMKNCWRGEIPKDISDAYENIVRARNLLITNNMPLAINRAKRFYNAVPKGHLSLMDMISLCAGGLCTGIDKWSSPAYSKVFLSVCIGRMTSNLMGAYNETLVTFSQQQEKTLYRANSISSQKDGNLSLAELTIAINETLIRDSLEKGDSDCESRLISEEELGNLLAAARAVSIDSPISSNDDDVKITYRHSKVADTEKNPEEIVADKNLIEKTYSIVDKMPLVEIKILKLKGMLS